MKVKICGIKTFDDALAAIDAGADMLGFNFYPPSHAYSTDSACLTSYKPRPNIFGVLSTSQLAISTA
jgi:phosphoribosylanthranilate isomerase